MTSTAPDNADHSQLEEIVAYLDGELSPAASVEVEQRLATDEVYRQELQRVDRAWHALDHLPQATVDDKFARTTLELVVSEAQREVAEKTQLLPAVRRRSLRRLALVACGGLAAGLALFWMLRPDPNRELIADLPVIQRVEIYSQFRELDFLRDLQRRAGDVLPATETVGDASSRSSVPPAQSADLDQRRDYLEQLEPGQRTHLRAKYNRFRSLPAEEKQRLRDMHQQIVESKDADPLFETLDAYQRWLASVPPAQQFELRSMDADARVETVRKWAVEMQEEAAFRLTDEQLNRLAQAMFEPMPQVFRALAERRMQDGRRNSPRDRFDGDFRRDALMEIMTEEREGPGGPYYQRIVEALPEQTARAFELLSPERRRERLLTWMRQATALRGEVSQKQLEEFFAEDLDASVREELLLLPPSEMEEALQRLYSSQGGRQWAGWGRFNRGGPDRSTRFRDDGPRARDDEAQRSRPRRVDSEFRGQPPRGQPPFEGPPRDGPPPWHEGPPPRPPTGTPPLQPAE